ncbi:MAG: acetylxylan esterase [Thermoguttaceae bacterium]|jgi:cephalosporin-C deacetylase-like acetyl esterase|nr:acetylxylan esterase [Thermoguttaceae bacterium]
MLRVSRVAQLSVGLLAVLASLAVEAAQVQVVTDRPDALYETGEQVKFLITVTEGEKPITAGKVAYVLTEDGLDKLGDGTVELGDEPAVVTGKLGRPGFLQCEVTFQTADGNPARALAGAGISPTDIPPSMPVPDDFDQFWADQKAQLAQVPMNPKLTPVDVSNADIECFDVQLECLGGAPVSGYFGRPKGAKPGTLPAILWVHGAGVRSSGLGSAVSGAGRGMLSMDINAHGIANGKPAEYYEELKEGALKDYRFAGRESRETIYFRGMYLRLVRAIDFLTSQPEWNGKVLAVVGHSQGGGQALVAGGLDPRVTVIGTGVPAICDHTGRAAGRINGWPKLVPMGDDGKPEHLSLEASRYVDAVNFASRCKADAIMSVGFIDRTCPPTTNYAAYNLLQGKKQVINKPLMGHSSTPDIHQAFLEFIEAHAAEKTTCATDR